MGPDGIPTVADLQAHLGEPGSGHDAALRSILSGVLDLVSQQARGVYLGTAATRVVILSGGDGQPSRLPDSPASYPRGRRLLYLPHPPAPAVAGGNPVTLVEIRDSQGGTWRSLVEADWSTEGRLLRRTDGLGWPPFESSVRVTYRAGYDATSPMPRVVWLGVLDGAAAEWRQRVRANPGLEILEPGSSPSLPRTFWKAVDAVRPPPAGF